MDRACMGHARAMDEQRDTEGIRGDELADAG
jgi:hypothetical protein